MIPLLLAGISGLIGKDVNDISQKRAQDQQDAATIRAAGQDVQPVVHDPGDGMGPSATMVGQQAFASDGSSGLNPDGTPSDTPTSPKAAQDAANAYNDPNAKIQRQIGALISQGKTNDALDLDQKSMSNQALHHKYAQMMKDEGTNAFIDANMANAPSTDDIKAGKVSTFDLQGVDDFNKIGNFKFPAGAKGQWKVLQLGNGREVPDFQVLGPDGKPMGPFSARTLQAIHSMSLADREKVADEQLKQGQDNAMKAKEFQSIDAYRKGMVADKDKSDKNELPAGVKAAVAGIDEQMKSLSQIVNDGLAKGTLDATSQYAADRDGKPMVDKSGNPLPSNYGILQTKLATLQAQRRTLLEPFLNQGGGGNQTGADPLGMRNPQSPQDDNPNAPPAFQVSGNPGAFRQKLANQLNRGVSPQTMAAFDAQFPSAGGSKQPSVSPAQGQASVAAPNMASLGAITADRSLNAIQQQNIAALNQFASQAKTAEIQLAAAAKSGDANSIGIYATNLQAARDRVKAEAARRLGNNAPAYLASVGLGQ